MNINLTDDRTAVGSYDNRSSGGVLLMPKERHMREGAPISSRTRMRYYVRQTGRSFPALTPGYVGARGGAREHANSKTRGYSSL